ncbi:MAG: DNA translocase FtsK [Oscillospiraceae bacterium]
MATSKKTSTGAKSGGASASGKKTGSSGNKSAASAAKRPIRREVWAAVCFFVGLFSFIGYFNVEGIFIDYICKLIKGLIGYGYYLFPPAILSCAVILAFHRGRPVKLRSICLAVAPVVLGALAHLIFLRTELVYDNASELIKALYFSGTEMKSGGLISGLLAMGFKAMFSVYGAIPVFFFGLAALIMVGFKISPAKILEKSRSREKLEYKEEDYQEIPEVFAPQGKAAKEATAERISRSEAKKAKRAIDIPVDEEPQEEYVEKKVGFFNTNPRVKTPAKVLSKSVPETLDAPVPAPAPAADPTAGVKPLSVEEAADIAGVVPAEIKAEEIVSAPPRASRHGMAPEELKSETDQVARIIEEKNAEEQPAYHYPPVDLLQKGKAAAASGAEEIAMNRERLQSTLDSFGVNATITDITRGPTVTRYDLELEAGVKLTKLTNLAGDLALSLGVSGVRIAPIPDKISTVGVEVPNKIVSTVYLRDIIDSDAFRNATSKLSFAIGKDIGGNCICGNIAKLPHLLIAGTTGSGKSVCMNSLILSLIYKASPEEVRLIMIDPKMVELGIYNGIPHLYIPVVTDPKKAAGSLQWAVIEMLKRYRLFSEAGVRDLAGYNALQKKNGEPTLPQVVIVIDELADLMLVASKEVEESICRVAQMGRASGMHLVIATQRPSADVITGLMKANIPSRIAFAVSSAMESRIILDQQGAEKLVGSGDMLYYPLGSGKPKRIQGAFVTDEEREEVVNFVKQYSQAQYSDEIMAQIEKAAEDKSAGGAKTADEPAEEDKGSYDELLPQAVDVIFETKQASVSMLQRRLKLGYSRAARIVDQMEEIGVVGPFEGSKPRQILITKEQWQEMQMLHGTAPVEKLPEQMGFADLPEDRPDDWGDE